MDEKFQQLLRWLQSHKRAVVRGFWGTIGIVALIRFLDWIGRVLDTMVVLQWFWEFIVFMGTFIVVPLALAILAVAHWDKVSNQFREWIYGPAFEIRPICGNSFAGLNGPIEVVSKIAITNVSGRLQKRCSVRVLEAFPIRRGQIMGYPQSYPSVHPGRGETFLLRWEQSEPSEQNRMYLDIPSDGAERIAQCLIADHEYPGRAVFSVARPDGAMDDNAAIRGPTWWKLKILVASESGPHTTAYLLANCGDDPGPITLNPWLPQGEQILEIQREEIRREKEE